QDVLQTVFQKAAQRFIDRIPPGYKDEQQKEGQRRFGDVVLWFQLLDIAKERKKPVIFVTADSKEDWWTKEGRPRPELIHEMFLDAKVTFHMYKPAQFVTYAGKFLDLKKEAKSVEKAATELREIESQRKVSQITFAPNPLVAAALAHLTETKPNPLTAAIFAGLTDYKPDPSLTALAHLAEIKPNPLTAAIFAGLADYKPDPSLTAALAHLTEIKPNPSITTKSALPVDAVKEHDVRGKSGTEATDRPSQEDKNKKK